MSDTITTEMFSRPQPSKRVVDWNAINTMLKQAGFGNVTAKRGAEKDWQVAKLIQLFSNVDAFRKGVAAGRNTPGVYPFRIVMDRWQVTWNVTIAESGPVTFEFAGRVPVTANTRRASQPEQAPAASAAASDTGSIDIKKVPGIGPARAKALKQGLDITTVQDLLSFTPEEVAADGDFPKALVEEWFAAARQLVGEDGADTA